MSGLGVVWNRDGAPLQASELEAMAAAVPQPRAKPLESRAFFAPACRLPPCGGLPGGAARGGVEPAAR